MPKFYTTGKYDVAGFCVGVVEEDEYIDGRTIVENDIIIGIESSGLHSNGFSLINDMLWRHEIAFADHPVVAYSYTHLCSYGSKAKGTC